MSKNKKIIFIVLAVVIVLIATWWFLGKPAVPYCKITNPFHCENDNDCVCVDAENPQQGGCFLGNKNYYEKCADKSDVCVDFCTGWGQPPVKCINNKCTNDYKTGEVAIITDKAEYQTANEIKIIVANNKDREVIISSCPFGERFADVERKLDSGEYELIVLPRIDVICSGPYYLKKGRSHTYTWGEFISSTNTTDTIFNPPGTYRIKFGYLTDLPYTEENTRWIYSNEFEIKAKTSQAGKECQTDSDCALINYQKNNCCFTCLSEAVNKAEAQQRLEWQEQNRCDIKNMPCPEYECEPGPFKAICLNNKCIKVKDENASCDSDENCQYIDCSKYNRIGGSGFKPTCVLEGICKCVGGK